MGHGYRLVAELSGTEETSASLDVGKVSFEELNQAIMAAAGGVLTEQQTPPKSPRES